jgi:EAL domain-containing protein (putative c-di-GMP-specific phosphodiesterase class I)
MGVNSSTDKHSPHIQFDHAKTACNLVRRKIKEHLKIYDDSIRQQELFTGKLINDVEKAVKEQQFEVYYQPKYDIQSIPPKLVSAEALVRWNHSEFGLISPSEFIPLFEENGIINIVDRYVFEEAAFQVAEWKAKFGYTIPISVNVSRTDIFDPDFEKNLTDIINKYRIEPKELMLEVTESAYTDDPGQLIYVIERLRSKGFLVEMDDFGSGYSSLNMISALPIDVLKMDRSFIKNIKPDTKEFRLVELILDIAKYLEVPVVAEGVETEEQVRLLHNAKCDYVQGFYFSKPLPPKEFEKTIIRQEA